MFYRNFGDVRRAQEARRLAEQTPTDWDLKRRALIESGLVDERAQGRAADAPPADILAAMPAMLRAPRL
jgi:hypothetical protein